MIGYHVTPRKNWKSIMRTGLEPRNEGGDTMAALRAAGWPQGVFVHLQPPRSPVEDLAIYNHALLKNLRADDTDFGILRLAVDMDGLDRATAHAYPGDTLTMSHRICNPDAKYLTTMFEGAPMDLILETVTPERITVVGEFDYAMGVIQADEYIKVGLSV